MLWWLESVAADDVAAVHVPHTRRFSVFGLLGAFGAASIEPAADCSPQKQAAPDEPRWGLPYRRSAAWGACLTLNPKRALALWGDARCCLWWGLPYRLQHGSHALALQHPRRYA